MEKIECFWDHGEDGNVAHLAEHDVTVEEAEFVLQNYSETIISRSTGRPARVGETPAGRELIVVFEWIDAVTVYPITAYEPDPENKP